MKLEKEEINIRWFKENNLKFRIKIVWTVYKLYK